MRKFLKYCILFVLPIFIFMVGLEVLLHSIPNSYKYKYDYVRTKGESIKAVAVGHSQFYDDFKSEDFYLPAFNLSNSAQGYMEDYYVLKELLPYMPNLEMVLLPIGYMTVGREEEFTQKSCFYHEYMNVDYDGKLPLQYRFECLSVRSSIKKILLYYLKHDDVVRCDSLGWSPQSVSKREKPLGESNVIDTYTILPDASMFLAGESYLINILDLLEQNNITAVLVSAPYYWTGYEKKNNKQEKWAINYIQNLCKERPHLIWINMESDPMFIESDFFDESHLTVEGAEKFTKKLSEEICKSIQQAQ